MNNRLARLEEEAIAFIRNAENLALRMDESGFHVAFFRRQGFPSYACACRNGGREVSCRNAGYKR